MFCVYVLWFYSDGHLYVGSTNDLTRRLSEHRRGHVISTRNRGPFKVVHTERYESERKAREREKYLKTGVGREELKMILRKRL